MRIQAIGVYVIFLISSLEISSVESTEDILREVSLISGRSCYGSSLCGTCDPMNSACGLSCNGRIKSPTLHVLSSSSNHFSYCVQPKSLSPPSGANNARSRQFTFQTNRTCAQELNLDKSATISFWIQGSCTPECEFVTVNGSQGEAYKLSLDGTKLKVKESEISSLSTSWKHFVFRMTDNTIDFFVDGNYGSPLQQVTKIPTLPTVRFGPAQGFQNGDSVSFVDVRVYEDFLTDREIKSLYNNGNLPTDPSCRCPISHPNQTTKTTCSESNSNTNKSRFSSSEKFYDIQYVSDNDESTVWEGRPNTSSTPITLKLKLYDRYKITKVNVLLKNSIPPGTTAEINSPSYPCSINSQDITCTKLPSTSTNEITLKIKTQGSEGLQISEIKVSGDCDCNEQASCNPQNSYETYTCNCTGNYGGQKCTECLPGYDINGGCTRCKANFMGDVCDQCGPNYYSYFDQCLACRCTVNSTSNCNNLTGHCNCNQGVTGKYCDECEDKYKDFDLMSSNVCEPCNCSSVGSSNTTCNKSTGQCPCIDKNTDLQCIPVGTVSPSFGPEAGGTIIVIDGKHLGQNPTVRIGGVKQILNSSNFSRIEVRSVGGSGAADLVVSWNKAEDKITQLYTYKPNPVLESSQNNSNINILAGCRIEYKGSNLDSVYQPKLEFLYTSSFGNCSRISGNLIECIVPQDLEKDVPMESYLHMDCPGCGVYQNVTIGPNPEVKDDLKVDFTYPFDKTITITGKQFNVCNQDDIKVMIGGKKCEIEGEITPTEITCAPPKDSPDENKTKIDIMVHIGQFQKFKAGDIIYRDFVESEYFIYIMIGVVAFVLIAIGIFITICCKCRSRNRNENIGMNISAPARPIKPNSYTEMEKIDIIRPPTSVISGVANPALDSMDGLEETKKRFLNKLPHGLKPEVEPCIINENEFSFGKICTAKGDKARMIDGKLTKGYTICPILIKSIKKPFQDDEEYPEWVFKTLTECVRFRNLSNSNILGILGIGLEKKKFHILYPYMKNKTLKDFVSNEKMEFSLKQLLGYGVQISEGMCFLYDHDIIHEDLATRNCMVSEDSLIKISDASFSHDFYPTEYMLDLTKNRYLPIRWMAPESIKFGFYDVKSDVWSYGVLLWELLTRGCLPFIDTADSGVYDLIVQGYRLGKPEIISDEIYELINKCWEEDSEFRPSFTIIRDRLSSLMVGNTVGNDDLYINWTEPGESIYMNSESFKRKSSKPISEPYYGNI